MIVQAGQSSACYDADFDPFGIEHLVTNTCPQNYKFGGKERDAESGLDDFEARYYSSQFGRFHSADWSAIPAPVPYADLGNPQTLNLYAYVKNNPMNLSDPTGHLGVGQLGAPEGLNVNFREIAGGTPIGPGDAVEPGVWEVTVNGESSFALGTYADAVAAQAGVQPQEQSSVVQDIKDTAAGAISAWAKDNGAAGPVQGNDLGQAIGHIGALVQGMYEMVQGGTAALAGGTEALVTAPAAATGVGAVIPGAGAVVAVAGVAEAVHGAAVFGNTLSNIHAASEHKKGARPSTEQKHTDAHSSRTGDKLRKGSKWEPKKGAGGKRSPGSWRDKEGE